MEGEYGRYHYHRIDLPIELDRGRRAVARMQEAPPARLAGLPVARLDTLDGLKLLFGDAGWILFRCSGTEPVLRIYCEAQDPALVDRLMRAGIARLRRLGA
jgi:phosphomannomutase